MSEFITIQVGQCGNQIGSSLWPSILQEYGIQCSGPNTSNVANGKKSLELQKTISSFFNIPKNMSTNYKCLSDLVNDKVKARAICIDMEDSVLSRFKNGPLKSIFSGKCFVSNYPGSGNNWAEGYWHHGPKYENNILKTIRNTVERCDSLDGFLLLFSVGGGTGSGLGTYVLKLLAEHYPEIERFVCCVYPIGTEDVITCPSNMGFATEQLIEHASCVFPVENRALLDISSSIYKSNKQELRSFPSQFDPFSDLNSIIVNMLLHLTSGSRFAGSLNLDMNEINTNMVPYPNLKFISSGFGPFRPEFVHQNSKLTSKKQKDEIFVSTCSKSNQLLKLNPLGPTSVLLGVTLLGRGDYNISDMQSYVQKLQAKGKFTGWSSKAVKLGLCNVASRGHRASMLSLFNTTSTVDLFQTISTQFSKLYNKKAHIHHYTSISGFEEDNFEECLYALNDMEECYRGIQTLEPVKVPRLLPRLID